MAREYIAFISYRHAPRDSAVAQTAHSLIEQYRIPRSLRKNEKKRFGYVFRDQEELPVSSDLSDDICKALDHSQNLIVICSPETQKSPWVAREIGYFLEHHDHSRVFAVLAGGEPADVFPAALTHVTRPDGTVTEVEPLAMDARAHSVGAMKRKLRSQIRRLYAALLGCPYDKLILRQQRRTWRRIATVAAVILAAVVGFSSMLLVKNAQIQQQNQELAAQKEQLLLRESEFLTRDAQEFLAAQDRASAAASAVAALPAAEGERPYYPQAEAALIQALGVFEQPWSGYWVTETQLPLSAPVEAMAFSQDNTRLVAADRHNEVSCFQTATGEKLWSVLLDTAEITHMQAQSQQVLCLHSGGLTALSWEDGSVLWDYRNHFVSDLPGVFSEDGTRLMLLQWRMTMDFERYEFYLVELDTRTGCEVQTVFVTQGMSLSATEEIPYVEFAGVPGAFSADGTAFAGIYTYRDASDQQHLAYYIVDLTDGTAQTVYTRQAGEDAAPAQVWFDGSACIAVYGHSWSKVAVSVEKVDCIEGKRLWHTQTPEENDWIEYDVPMNFLRGGDSLYITCDRYIYGLDLASGQGLCQQSMGAPILSIRIANQYYLEFLAADGSYVLGWRNDTGMYLSDRVFGDSIHFGSMQQAYVWGEPMLQMMEEDAKLLGADVSDGGAIALIPEEGAEYIAIRRVQLLEDLSGREQLDWLPEGVTLQEGQGLYLQNGLALGMVDDNGSNAVLIQHNGNIRLQPSAVWNMDELYLLPDGSGYISYGDTSQNLVLYDEQGTAAVLLLEQSEDVLSENNGTQYLDRHWNMALRYSAEGDVLAAANDDETLYLWENGLFLREVTLPEELNVSLYDSVQYYRMLEVSEEYIYLSHYADAQDISMDAVAVYSIAEDTWRTISCDQLALTKAFLTPDSNGRTFVLLDDADVLHRYDAAGNLLYSQPFPVPSSVLRQLEFVAGDRYLVARTKDQQVLLLDAATGELLLRQRLGTQDLGNIRCYTDETNGRLYLTNDYSPKDEGLCLDMGSWTILARIPGFICYDVREDSIYRLDETGNLIRCRLPAMEELTDYYRSELS